VPPFTEKDLAAAIVSAGGPPAVSVDSPAFLDVAFADLGYDSLARLEAVGLVQARWGLELPDDILDHACTPRELFHLVLEAMHVRAGRAG
jgi:minimal PKS acyl carrier protein